MYDMAPHAEHDPDGEYPGGWFGPAPFAPVCDSSPHRPTPAGRSCVDCKDPIAEGDRGFLIPGVTLSAGAAQFDIKAIHLACFLRDLGIHPRTDQENPKRGPNGDR